MIRLEEKIIKRLKSNLGLSEIYFDKNYPKSYLRKYEDNLENGGLGIHLEEFKRGNGSELKDRRYPAKMKALRSSSVFSVNLFGNGNYIHISPNAFVPCRDYKLSYEEKRKTIKRTDANIDVFLSSDDCDIYVEVKMLETLTYKYEKRGKSIISSYNSYQNKNNYYNSDSYSLFQPIFKHFHEDCNPIAFDTFQMLKHLLGLYNYYSKQINKKKVYLINCHWKFENIDYQTNKGSMSIFEIISNYEKSKSEYEKYTKTFQEAFAKIDIQLELLNLNHEEMMKILSVDSLGYMKRYNVELL